MSTGDPVPRTPPTHKRGSTRRATVLQLLDLLLLHDVRRPHDAVAEVARLALHVSGPVWKSKFYGAFVLHRRIVLHAIDATSARWRGDAGSSPLDRARTTASSPRNDL